MQIFQGPKKGVRRVSFSPDGRLLAASAYDGSLHVWDLANRAATKLVRGGYTPLSIAWTPDGQGLFWSFCTFNRGDVRSVSLAGEQTTVLAKGRDVASLLISPDGQHLYVATATGIGLWTLRGREAAPLREWPMASPGFLALSADGKTLASTHPYSALAADQTRMVVLWNAKTGQEKKRLLECREPFAGVGFSPDQKRLAAIGNQSIWLWEFPSGKLLANQTSQKFFTDLAWSPLGSVFATAGNDGAIRFWAGSSGAAAGVFTWDLAKALCVAFAPDGQRAAVGDSAGKIVVWDVE